MIFLVRHVGWNKRKKRFDVCYDKHVIADTEEEAAKKAMEEVRREHPRLSAAAMIEKDPKDL